MTTQRLAFVSLSSLSLLAASACAQSSAGGSGKSSGNFDKPLTVTTTVAEPPVTTDVRVLMSKNEGGDEYQVTIANGETSAKVNGKEVPKDRVRRSGDAIEILGKDGSVITTFNAATVHSFGGFNAGPGWVTARGLGGQNGNLYTWSNNPGQTPFAGTMQLAGPAPKVMLGVTMVEPGETLAEHYALEPGTGILLDRVIDGLPADKAGLKKGDIVISLDGTKPITVAKAREMLAEKKPGDKVKVVALRKGEEKAVTLELSRYDPARLGVHVDATDASDHARDLALKLEDAAKAHYDVMRTNPNGGAQGILLSPGGGRFQFSTAADAERLAELDRKLSELSEKMQKLDEALDRLQKKLDSGGR